MKSKFLLFALLGLSFQAFSQLGSPTLTSPSDGATYYVGSTINFSWTSVTDAVLYDVEFDSGTGYVFLSNVVGTGLSMPLVVSNTGPHTWHVRAKSATATGNWSSSMKYSVIGIPGVPGTVSPITDTNVPFNTATSFTWNNVTNATGYKIQFDSDAPIVVAGNNYPNTFTVLGNHTWKVLAFNPAGESAWSSSKNIIVVLGVSNLTSPANNNVTYTGSTLNFTWTPVSGATSYDIELDPGLGYASLTNISGSSKNLLLNTSDVGPHTWHIRARNGTFSGNWSNSRSYTVVGIPAIPITNNPQSGTDVIYNASTFFSWNQVANATSYQIQYDSETPITVTGTNYSRAFSSTGSHTWKVLASNNAGDSGWSSIKTFNVVLAAPPLNSPTNGSTSYIGATLGFSWTSVPGATSYDIEFDAGLGSATTSNVTFATFQLALNSALIGQHTWHVRAKSGSSIGQWSPSRTFNVAGVPGTPVLVSPSTESNITYEVASNFTWNPVQFATSYQIQFDSEAPLTVSNNSYSRTFNTLGSHSWKVKAINAAGESSWSTVNNFIVLLGVPALSSPSNNASFYVGSSASFSWSSVAGATSYDLEFDSGLGTVTLTNILGISSNLALIASYAGVHTWHVRAKSGTSDGAWSSTRNISIIGIPAVPVTNTPVSGSPIFYDSATSFSWNAVNNATSYKIQFDSESPITVSGTSYTRTYSSFGSHTWKVLASNNAGDSGWSSSKTFSVDLGSPSLSSPSNQFTSYVGSLLNFTWTSVAGATSYDIEFDAGQGSVSLSNETITSKQWALAATNVGNHTWHVRAKNGSTLGQWSQSRTFTVAGIPAIPVTLNPPADATVNYNSPVSFSWNPVQNASSYLIQFDAETPIPVSGASFQRTFSTLVSHTWKVKAVNPAGESDWSIVKTFTVILGIPNLTSPANKSTFYVGSTIEFSWTSVAGATSYDIEFDAGLGYVYTTNVTSTTLNILLTNANVGPHTWHVRAKLNTISGNWSSNRSYQVAGIPAIPVTVSPASGSTVTSEQNVTFNWNGVPTATSYKIQFDAEDPVIISGTSYMRTFSTLGNHTWKVLASNDAGDSSWSISKTFTVELGAPVLTSPANNSSFYVGSSINFSWTPITGATSYDIEFDAGLGYISTVNVTSASYNQLLGNVNAGSHTWHVRAKSNTVSGAWSNTRSYQVVGIPSAPVLVTPVDGALVPFDTPISFTWSSVTGASGYQIQYDSETAINVSGTTYSRSFNTPGNHTWRVLATNASGNGSYSNANTFIMDLGAPTLSAPVDAASMNVGSTINFTWSSIPGATSYDVEFDNGTPNGTTISVNVSNMNLLTTTAMAGSHSWRVRAKLNTTTSAWSSTRNYTIYNIPSIPVLVTPSQNESVVNNTPYNFTWNLVSGATGYKIQLDNETPVSVSGTSYSKSFTTLGLHTWKVLATNNAGESGWSSPGLFSVDLGKPTLISPANAFNYFVGSSISYSWTLVIGADSYDIEIDAGMPSVSSVNVVGASYSKTADALAAGTHTWHVRAKLGASAGAWSTSQTYSVTGVPSIPALIGPATGITVYSETVADFTWNASTNATSYQIQFDSETPVVVTGTTYSQIFNTAGIHSWKVLATNAAGNSDWSTVRTFTLVIGSPILKTKVLSVTPDNNWNFGTVTINNTNTKTIELLNSGNNAIKVTNVTLTGTNSDQYSLIGSSGASFDIAAGETVKLTISFKPTSEGLKNASLTIANNSDNAPTSKIILLGGTGTLLPTKTLTVEPDVQFDFGNLNLNSFADKIFTLQNSGTSSINFTGIALSGLNSDQYTIINAINNFDIEAGGNRQITIRFKPLTAGIKSAVLIMTNNADNTNPSKQITLSGSGVAQQIFALPTVVTTTISEVASNAATSGGNVSSDGNASVTAKGICWSKAENPVITDSRTVDGTGIGSYVSAISGLAPGTIYHVRAYATNSVGTSYGSDISFTTQSLATVTTSAAKATSATAATGGGNVSSDGGATVTTKGSCWSKNENPTILDAKTNDGTGTGIFTSAISGLSAGTTYHTRAYATNSVGTSYGADVLFTTPSPATVTTISAAATSSTTALGKGDIISDGGTPVIQKGFCWAVNINPTTADSKTTNGTGLGSFSDIINGLNQGTTYHVRAYATNMIGTSYGADIQFTTPTLATVVTSSVAPSENSSTTGVCKGNVTNDGGASVSEKGFCWSINANPAIGDSRTTDGTGIGAFSDILSGLTPGTIYHVRAYATNAVGSAYGADMTFKTTVNNGIFNISSFYQIYPNPSHGRIKILVKENVPVDMSLFTLEGVLIENQKLLNQETILDLNLPKGMYLIELKCDKANGSYKIIIQ